LKKVGFLVHLFEYEIEMTKPLTSKDAADKVVKNVHRKIEQNLFSLRDNHHGLGGPAWRRKDLGAVPPRGDCRECVSLPVEGLTVEQSCFRNTFKEEL
jgi:hypothetical protein